MIFQSIKRCIERWAKISRKLAVSMDASPTDILQWQVNTLRIEIKELRRQVDELSITSRHAM